MDQEESTILEALDTAVRAESVIYRIDVIVFRVKQKLRVRPDDVCSPNYNEVPAVRDIRYKRAGGLNRSTTIARRIFLP